MQRSVTLPEEAPRGAESASVPPVLAPHEAFSRALFENAALGVLILDLQGRVVESNAALQQMLGYSAGELQGKHFAELTAPEDQVLSQRHFEDLLAQRVAMYRIDKRYVRKDGTLVWVGLTSSLLHEPDAPPQFVMAVVENITARRKGDEAAQFLASIVESADDAIIGKTLDGIIVSWNAGAQRTYGYTAAEAVGRHISLLVPPDHEDELPQILAKIRRAERVEHYETTRVTKDGRRLDVSLTICAIRDANGTITGASTIARDITAAKRTEEALRHSEAILRSFYDSAPYLMGVLEIVGDDLRHISDNRATAEFMGLSPEALRDRLASELGDAPGVVATWVAQCREADHRQEPVHFEYTPGSAADARWLAATVAPIQADQPGPARFSYVIEDVTEKKQATEKIEQLNAHLQQRTVALEAAVKELEAFSYSVSHDLRAPLRAITGFANAVIEDCGAQVDADGRHYLQRISENAQNMGRLIDDLLAFSRVGRQQMALAAVDMTQLAAVVIEELRGQNPNRPLQFELAALPPAHGDLAMLRQVFVNLLNNAVKFTRDRAPAIIAVTGQVDGDRVTYTVRDNGAGFDMQYAEKLFGVFQRLHSIKEYEGTGVGLALVQRIVRRHGGEVRGEGHVEQGATFTFTLPYGGSQCQP